MGLFGARNDETEPAETPPRPPAVFEPQPLEDWDLGESAVAKSPVLGDFDFYAATAAAASRKKGAEKLAGKGDGKKLANKKLAYEVRPPEPGMSESERRAALRAQMADLTRAYKDASIEEMERAIKETLVAHGQEVPGDWVSTIAEGLRRNGPTPINYDGVHPRKP